MEKTNSIRPILFCFGTELVKYEINERSVQLTLKLPNNIDLYELQNQLSKFFNVNHTHTHTFGDKNEYLYFIGS